MSFALSARIVGGGILLDRSSSPALYSAPPPTAARGGCEPKTPGPSEGEDHRPATPQECFVPDVVAVETEVVSAENDEKDQPIFKPEMDLSTSDAVHTSTNTCVNATDYEQLSKSIKLEESDLDGAVTMVTDASIISHAEEIACSIGIYSGKHVTSSREQTLMMSAVTSRWGGLNGSAAGVEAALVGGLPIDPKMLSVTSAAACFQDTGTPNPRGTPTPSSLVLPDGFTVTMPTDLMPTDMVTVTIEPPSADAVPKEEVKRIRDRQKKRELRTNPTFREKERVAASVRMRSRRLDPTYRDLERQRDRVRRQQARLENASLRERERCRDKAYRQRRRVKAMSLAGLMPREMAEGDGEAGPLGMGMGMSRGDVGGHLLGGRVATVGGEGGEGQTAVESLERGARVGVLYAAEGCPGLSVEGGLGQRTLGLGASGGGGEGGVSASAVREGGGSGQVTVMDANALDLPQMAPGDPPRGGEVFMSISERGQQGDEYG